jgi:hypothetical protein
MARRRLRLRVNWWPALTRLAGALAITLAFALCGSLAPRPVIRLNPYKSGKFVLGEGRGRFEEVVFGALPHPGDENLRPPKDSILEWSLVRREDRLFTERAFGWPLVCLAAVERDDRYAWTYWSIPGGARAYEYDVPSPRPVPNTRGTKLGSIMAKRSPGQMTLSSVHARVIPLRPLPLRLAFNVGFWYVTYAAVASVGTGLRGLARRARGRCATCNYGLSGLPPGSPCPECAARPPAPPNH